MLNKNIRYESIHVTSALRWVGIAAGVWALAVVLSATLAYLPGHPDFSIFTTYMSDIGDSEGLPQILFNSGTLMAQPLRLLALLLICLRLASMGARRSALWGILFIGLVSAAGTAMMTAVPYSVAPAVHLSGIPLYFLGVVAMQIMLGIIEWRIADIHKALPAASFVVVVVFFVFAALMMLYQQGIVMRDAPVLWEWLAFLSSIVWLFMQSIYLGRKSVIQPG